MRKRRYRAQRDSEQRAAQRRASAIIVGRTL